MEQMDLNTKKMRRSLIVGITTLPIVLVITLMVLSRNPSFSFFQGFNYNLSRVFVQNESTTTCAPAPVADEHRNTTAASGPTGSPSRSGASVGRERTDQLSISRNDSITPSINNSFSSQASIKNSSEDSTYSIQNKKLLNGLLSHGFNQPSCISRYNSYKYHNNNPSHYKPSPYLISKLRSYEHLHRHCGPYSKSYANFIKKHNSSNSTSMIKEDGEECKYFVWTAANGLGNRMISMVSSFLYAVLTDRVFLVEFDNSMMGLFCEPFLNSTWELSNDFPYNHHFSELRTYKEFWIMKDANSTNGQLHDGGDSEVGLPSMMFLDLGHGNDVLSHPFHCEKNQDQVLNKVPVLVVRTDQYIVPSLYMSEKFMVELDKMFPQKETVFYHLSRYLFHPSNQVWRHITNFYGSYLAKSDQIIGLQIRVFSPKHTPVQTIMDQILRCSTNYSILPQLILPSSNTSQTKSISILVTSLYPEYAETLKKMYRSHPTVGVYQPSYEGEQKFYNETHNMMALVDMYLLSLCDVLVTSGVSTFGYVAQGLGGLKPWIMQKPNGDKVRDPACYPALSMEPCNHFPPTVDCVGNEIKNFSEVWRFMRQCEDRKNGVKIVDI